MEAEAMEILPDSVWRHRNGNVYRVLMIANLLDAERYPKTIVYQNVKNGSVWSRPYADWHRSFTREAENERGRPGEGDHVLTHVSGESGPIGTWTAKVTWRSKDGKAWQETKPFRSREEYVAWLNEETEKGRAAS